MAPNEFHTVNGKRVENQRLSRLAVLRSRSGEAEGAGKVVRRRRELEGTSSSSHCP